MAMCSIDSTSRLVPRTPASRQNRFKRNAPHLICAHAQADVPCSNGCYYYTVEYRHYQKERAVFAIVVTVRLAAKSKRSNARIDEATWRGSRPMQSPRRDQ
jgi:hypothetical protein